MCSIFGIEKCWGGGLQNERMVYITLGEQEKVFKPFLFPKLEIITYIDSKIEIPPPFWKFSLFSNRNSGCICIIM